MKKVASIFLAAAMVLAMGGVTAFAAEADDIKAAINDPRLEEAIIEAVGGEENLTGANIRQIKELSVTGKGIQDLQGIQMLTGLETLDLSGNKLEVIAQLGDLKDSLKSLNLSDNLIKETGPLSLLTNLTSLDVSGNQIEDGGGIANLTNLTALNIADNKICLLYTSFGTEEVGAVFFGINGHGAQTQVIARADNPNRNFAAVGDEYFIDFSFHRCSSFFLSFSLYIYTSLY